MERDRLERDLLTRSAPYREAVARVQVTPEALCAALPADTGLLDLVRFDEPHQTRYLAFLLKPGCQVHRIALGPAEVLEDAIQGWRTLLEDAAALPARVDARVERLADLLWASIAPHTTDLRKLRIAPDGPLSGVSFGALPTGPGRYVLETLEITYLESVAELLRQPAPGGTSALVVGGVDFDAGQASGGANTALAPCNLRDFAPLPGAGWESAMVAKAVKRGRLGDVEVITGPQATEAAVGEALPGRAIAHIATHGFFATGRCRSAIGGEGVGFGPMVLSGLALAGANSEPGALDGEDGIFTAAEVAALDLSETGLVVLSACDSGLGEVSSGQGVLGLRRAFAPAGRLIMSLWAVPDDETAALMDDLYKLHVRRRQPLPAAEALRAAQLRALARQRARGAVHPGAWGAFVASGGGTSGGEAATR